MNETLTAQEQYAASQPLIILRKDQKKCASYDPPFSVPEPMSEEEVAEHIVWHLGGVSTSTEKLVMSHLRLAVWLVARFLQNWPQSRPYADDMFSEACLGITEMVNKIEEGETPKSLQCKCTVRAKYMIQIMLNNYRHIVGAGFITNYKRVKSGADPISGQSTAYQDAHGKGYIDDGPAYVDMMDELEHLSQIDGEELVDLVFLAMESEHGILEEELTERERELIASLSKIGANCGISVSRNSGRS